METYKLEMIARMEAIKAAARVVTNKGGSAGNLLTEAQVLYGWITTGRDPVVDLAQ